MKSNIRLARIRYKDLAYKILVFIVVVSCITYFLPREGKFNYQYELNRPWRYGQLIAPFDFPIYKESKVIKTEMDSLMKYEYRPYYRISQEITDSIVNKFNYDYSTKLNQTIDVKHKEYIAATLRDIYSVGIIASDTIRQLNENGIRTIMVTESKTAYEVEVPSLYTVMKAYEKIVSNHPKKINVDLLRQANLHKYITPNLFYEAERTKTAKKELLASLSQTRGLVCT